MAFKLFELVEQFIKDTFFVKINPIWKNMINRQNFFISLRNLIINFHFRN